MTDTDDAEKPRGSFVRKAGFLFGGRRRPILASRVMANRK